MSEEYNPYEDPNNFAHNPIERVHAIGLTPIDAAINWCETNHGTFEAVIEDPEFEKGNSGDGYDWGLRFLVGDGTHIKSAGKFVPGGVVMTWWK